MSGDSSRESQGDGAAALERELDVLLAKAKADVPPDRRAGILAAYADMKRMAELIRVPMTAADEPSNVFSLSGYARSSVV